MRQAVTIRVLFILMLLSAFAGFLSVFVLPNHGTQPFDYNKEKMLLEQVFHEKGSKAAYDYYKKKFSGYDPATVHGLEHILGNEIYRREGLKGILLCDDMNIFGCYHGFMGAAISLEGPDLIPRIDELCGKVLAHERINNRCFHGMGHGLLAHRGYTMASLARALVQCDIVSSDFGRKGCYSGVLMEYDTQALVEEMTDRKDTRIFDPHDPFSPCPVLQERYQPTCYFEQVGWWRVALNDDFVQMGTLCDRLANRDYRTSCFRGIGRMVIGVKRFNVDNVITTCRSLTIADGRAPCMYEAAEQFAATHQQAPSDKVCKILSSEYRQPCTFDL